MEGGKGLGCKCQPDFPTTDKLCCCTLSLRTELVCNILQSQLQCKVGHTFVFYDKYDKYQSYKYENVQQGNLQCKVGHNLIFQFHVRMDGNICMGTPKMANDPILVVLGVLHCYNAPREKIQKNATIFINILTSEKQKRLKPCATFFRNLFTQNQKLSSDFCCLSLMAD